jgi:hypothetical protein
VLALACVAIALFPAGASAKRHRADGKLGEWKGKPTMLAGRTQVSRGELIYTDYLYDDYGPNANGAPDIPQFRDNLAPKSGDYGYPNDPDRYGYNAADLRELRLAADRRGLHALIGLQTMKAPDATAVEIAIDTDGNPNTGTAEWPDGAGLRTAGADRFITTWGTGARITDAGGGTHTVHHAVNLDENAIELDVSRKRLGKLGRSARVWAASGLATDDGAFMPRGSSTPVYDLAFQGAETYDVASHWGDKRQSAALAKADVSDFGYPLQARALRKRRTHLFQLTSGYYNRIFRSNDTYGEGIDLKKSDPDLGTMASGSAKPMFLGRYQPYGLYVPKGYSKSAGAPLLLDGHSLDVNQNEYAAVGTRQLPQLGDDRGSLIITPLARGIDTWYLDSGLVDVFEAWNDVKRHYNADPDRTSITGYSMGGYMTYRLGLLMPDAFVRAAVYVGPPAYYSWPYPLPLQSTDEWRVPGNTNQIVDNGLDLPFEINHGNLDELVPVSGVQHQVDTFEAAGNPFRFYHHLADDHLGFIAVANQWGHTARFLGTGRRNLSPVRVRYVRYPSMDIPRAGLKWDGAYWVDRLEVRNAGAVGDHGEVDATTEALGGNKPRLVKESTSVSHGEGGISPATVTGQHYEPGDPIQERNAFRATLTNMSKITFLSRRMGIDRHQALTATLSGDGETLIGFKGRWRRGVKAELDGQPVKVARKRHSISVSVNLGGSGPHQLTIH